jgi:hypothetical protein
MVNNSFLSKFYVAVSSINKPKSRIDRVVRNAKLDVLISVNDFCFLLINDVIDFTD